MNRSLLCAVLGGLIAFWAANAQSSPPADASQSARTEPAADADLAAPPTVETKKAFQPPPGYQKRLRNGQEVYCRQIVPAGSRITRTECFTEAQIASIEEAQRAYREDMRKQGAICADARCSGS
jgi:hypothetical protein